MQPLFQFMKDYPLLSSAVQVGILGTLGELLAARIRLGKWTLFGPGVGRLAAKIAVWAFLGVTFKYAFTGFHGFVDALVAKEFWFASAARTGLMRAFSASLFTNLLFGPVMMLFHRWTDNAIERKAMHWPSLQKAWWTLLWFWIPAHTITFSLPAHLQVGLAALWALVLGIILGFFARGVK